MVRLMCEEFLSEWWLIILGVILCVVIILSVYMHCLRWSVRYTGEEVTLLRSIMLR